MRDPIAIFFLMLRVGGKCFDHLYDLFSGPPHNFSAQMGTNTAALKFDISEPRMDIHTIKTRDRKQCMPVPFQPKCGRTPSAHNCGSRLQPTKLNQLTLLSSRTTMLEEKYHKWGLHFCVRFCLQQSDGGPKRNRRRSKAVLNTTQCSETANSNVCCCKYCTGDQSRSGDFPSHTATDFQFGLYTHRSTSRHVLEVSRHFLEEFLNLIYRILPQ